MRPIKAMLLSPFVAQEFVMLLADMSPENLVTLGKFMQSPRRAMVLISPLSP